MNTSDRDALDEPTENETEATTPNDGMRSVSEVDRQQIDRKVQRAFELVPPIGKSWRRWYDLPYRLLEWLLFSWPRRTLPWRLIPRLGNALNFLGAFNHYDRLKVEPLDDSMENLVVPEDEAITQGGIWVVEFFPPSCYSNLQKSLAKNGWDEPSLRYGFDDGTNAQKVRSARRGKGFSWSNIGAVAGPKSGYSSLDVKREVIPEEFRLIQLTAVQLGHSLTAVTAFFRFSDTGEKALNNVWKMQHEPTMEWHGLRPPKTESRLFAAIRATQKERKRLHDLARSWLADRCGGFFSATKSGHPVVDFTMFAEFDPTTTAPTREFSDPLRALGMEGDHLFNHVSPQLPGAVLARGESLRRYKSEDLTNCWGLVGAHELFADQNDRVGYGSKPYSVATLAAMSDDAIRDFLLNVAVARYTEQLGEVYSDARDTAQMKHRRFRPDRVDKLRRELLTTSLDLPVVARDAASLWEPSWRLWNGIQVKAVAAPGVPYPEDGYDLIKHLKDKSANAFEQLLRDDGAYRDVLSTASALGASAASARLGRRALFVSGTSLLISFVSVLTADHASAWHHLVAGLADLRHFWLDPVQ